MGTGEERVRVDVGRYGIKKMRCITTYDVDVKESEDGIYYIDMPRLWIKVYKAE